MLYKKKPSSSNPQETTFKSVGEISSISSGNSNSLSIGQVPPSFLLPQHQMMSLGEQEIGNAQGNGDEETEEVR